MEFWLSQEDVRFQLPVLPSEFTVQKGNMNQTVQIENLGEITVLGQSKLSAITLTAFFPANEYSFCKYADYPKPYECVEQIETWRLSKKPVRLLVTETDINMLTSIEEFSYGEKDGSRDVYFTLSLKEYKEVKAKKDNNVEGKRKVTTRSVNKKMPKSYKVKAGDTLWDIAKRFYGDGSKHDLIAKKNGIKNPKALPVGKVLML